MNSYSTFQCIELVKIHLEESLASRGENVLADQHIARYRL